MKKIMSFVLAAAMALSLAACGSSSSTAASSKAASSTAASSAASSTASSTAASTSSASGSKFIIGTYLQLTGSNAVAGTNAKNGIDLAVKYINANGGFNGATVEVQHYDTTGSTEEAVKVVQKMIEGKQVNAIIGSVNSNEVSACIKYINDAKIYNFGLGTSATWMKDTSMIWTFRASCNNGRIAPKDAELFKKLGLTKVAIISGTDDTGKSTADAFESACKDQGLTVTTRQECDSEDTDFSGQITQILATKPDVIFMSLIGTTFGPFVKQVRNMGYKGMLGCKECFSAEYQNVAGAENCDYISFVYPYVAYSSIDDCNIPIMKSFLEKYKAEYGELPGHESAYRGWDTMMSMWEATKQAKSNDGDALRQAMTKVKIDGLGGQIDFTSGDREAYSNFNSFVLLNGKNVLIDDWLKDKGLETYKTYIG